MSLCSYISRRNTSPQLLRRVPLLGTSYSSIACSCPWVRSAPAAQHLHTPPPSARHCAHARATRLAPPTFLSLLFPYSLDAGSSASRRISSRLSRSCVLPWPLRQRRHCSLQHLFLPAPPPSRRAATTALRSSSRSCARLTRVSARPACLRTRASALPCHASHATSARRAPALLALATRAVLLHPTRRTRLRQSAAPCVCAEPLSAGPPAPAARPPATRTALARQRCHTRFIRT
jgi:hypothetical protein